MNTNELKMSWKDSNWTLNGEDDTGTSTVLSMMTVTKVLSAFQTDGYIVLQVVLDDTSIKSVDIKYAPTEAEEQEKITAQKRWETLQTSGSDWICYQPTETLRESQTVSLIDSDGVCSQRVVSEALEELSSRISTLEETVSSTTRSDIARTQTGDLVFLEGSRQGHTALSVSQNVSDTSASRREVGIPSFSGCVESQRSPFQARVASLSSNEWEDMQRQMTCSWFALGTETTQETDSWTV